MCAVWSKRSQLCPAGHLAGNRSCPEHEGIVSFSHTACRSGNSEGLMFSKISIVISLPPIPFFSFFLNLTFVIFTPSGVVLPP